jgi:hypothetical protein
MTTRVIKSEADLALLIQHLKARPRPYTVDIVKGKHRSTEQNKLQRLWLNEIAEQLGDRTAEEIRGYCKLVFGVPILRAENPAFQERYDAIIRPLPYETKLAIMTEPLDMPVTRLMTTDQKTRYLDAVSQHFLEQGIVLTDPETKKEAADDGGPEKEARTNAPALHSTNP